MAIRSIKAHTITWYYLTDFGSEELQFLKKNFKFHPLDLKDCAGEPQRSKVDVYKNYLFAVMQFPYLDGRRVKINQLYFFVGKDYIVSIALARAKHHNNFFYKVVHNQKLREEAFAHDSGYLLYRILDVLLRNSWAIHRQLDGEVLRIETEIDEGHGKKSVFDIAAMRRMILQLKAIIDPQRLVTNTLSRIDTVFLDKEIGVYFDDLDDFVDKMWFSLESYKDRVLSLQEINESLVSYRTNQIMKVLTGASVGLLPLTLLSGIYGMNIDLPFSTDPHLVWSLFLAVLLVIVGVFVYLRKKDWI